ncbi:MAG: hypothetical protein EB027_07465, partial [Actinobacteria bacterium]|nr:hypothetical protein [Actinomycetota bacterium]
AGVGPVGYSGSTGTLTVELANASGAKVSTTAALAAPAQATVAAAPSSLQVPGTITTTPGAVVAIPFGAQPLVAAGPVSLTFTASDASLTWLSDAVVKAASGDASGIAAGSGQTVTFYGTPEALNAYLSGGKLKAGGAGTVTVSGAASGTITIAAGALGTGTTQATQTRTVLLSLLDAGGAASASATLSATSLGGSGLSATVSGSATVVTSGDTGATATLTLVGTESALSAYLATPGALKFNATNGQSYTLRVTTREMSGAVVGSETSKLAVVNAIQPGAQGSSGAALVPAIGSLPATLRVTTGESSSLVFTDAALSDGNANADDTLTLTLSVATPTTGTRTLSASADANVTVVSGSGTTSLKLSGKASDLQAFLRAGSVGYNGDGTTLTIELSNAAGAKVIATAALTAPA